MAYEFCFNKYILEVKKRKKKMSGELPNFTRKDIKPARDAPSSACLLRPFSHSAFSTLLLHFLFFIFYKILKLRYVRNSGNMSNSLQIREL